MSIMGHSGIFSSIIYQKKTDNVSAITRADIAPSLPLSPLLTEVYEEAAISFPLVLGEDHDAGHVVLLLAVLLLRTNETRQCDTAYKGAFNSHSMDIGYKRTQLLLESHKSHSNSVHANQYCKIN